MAKWDQQWLEFEISVMDVREVWVAGTGQSSVVQRVSQQSAIIKFPRVPVHALELHVERTAVYEVRVPTSTVNRGLRSLTSTKHLPKAATLISVSALHVLWCVNPRPPLSKTMRSSYGSDMYEMRSRCKASNAPHT